jgi:hypothetical protein
MAKAKKKISVNAQVQEQVKQFEERSEIRQRVASVAYNAQDAKTKAVIDSIMDQLLLGASGTIRIFVGKQSVAAKVDMEYVEFNAMYVATEILKDLALMDVKVANYKFPSVYCVECGDKLLTKKKKKVKK